MYTVTDGERALESALIAQIELLELLAERERELQNHLLGRNWQMLEQVIQEMNGLARRIQQADQIRGELFGQLRHRMGLAEQSGMAEVVARLDDESSARLRALFRKLKVSVMRIQSLTGGIDAYVASTTATMRAFLNESFPERRGTIYGRDGSADVHSGHAVVIDRHL